MTTAAAKPERTFFGQPRALAYLAFTEAWERFSYYGMTALLVLYMHQALFLPDRVEGVAGFAPFRAWLESMLGPMTPLALATQIGGLYTGFVYFTPVIGGWFADRFIGRRAAVMMGAVLMSAGHIAMAFDASFLVALVLLIVGCGLLKGNISTQVGELYGENDGEGRTRGFAIFSMAINLGAMGGPFLCGWLAKEYGWHAGFALAGGLMLIGLATYIAGFRYLPEDRPRAVPAAARAPMGAHEWKIVGAIAVVCFITIFQSIAYYQNTSVGLVWIDEHVDLTVFGFDVPTAWFASIDPAASIVGVPLLFAIWRWQEKNGGEPGDLGKIAVGAWMAMVANLVLVAATLMGPTTTILVPLIYNILLGVAFLYYWPTLLALVSRTAPNAIKATLMGAVFLTLFVSNIIIGRIGGFYETMTPTMFWAMHAGFAAVGGVLALLLKEPLKRALEIK
jgi:proton-dependent oligopeptide transporter, POT family